MKRRWASILFIVSLLFASCEREGDSLAGNARVRTLIESTGTGGAEISVTVEGPDGNAVSGAVVLVGDSAKSVSILPFDYETCSYTGTRDVLADGVFTICVKSALLDDDYERSIRHVQLGAKPSVVEFRDQSGNSVLEGDALLASEPLQIAWESLGEGVVYVITLRTATTVYYKISAESCACQIPADTLTAGSVYYADIQAQVILGDPLYSEEDYYSASCSGSVYVNFSIQ